MLAETLEESLGLLRLIKKPFSRGYRLNLPSDARRNNEAALALRACTTIFGVIAVHPVAVLDGRGIFFKRCETPFGTGDGNLIRVFFTSKISRTDLQTWKNGHLGRLFACRRIRQSQMRQRSAESSSRQFQ